MQKQNNCRNADDTKTPSPLCSHRNKNNAITAYREGAVLWVEVLARKSIFCYATDQSTGFMEMPNKGAILIGRDIPR